MEEAISRCRRLGQTRPVKFYDYSVPDSFDQVPVTRAPMRRLTKLATLASKDLFLVERDYKDMSDRYGILIDLIAWNKTRDGSVAHLPDDLVPHVSHDDSLHDSHLTALGNFMRAGSGAHNESNHTKVALKAKTRAQMSEAEEESEEELESEKESEAEEDINGDNVAGPSMEEGDHFGNQLFCFLFGDVSRPSQQDLLVWQ
ncbi:uncharacterized protein BDV17DRAFT_287080 [Aspergillus undulatus]|uniref:uncharacterized protein n=1 Tax=Aspergillus undulatus TaxID=1810928 RepID=UPI003CCCAB55